MGNITTLLEQWHAGDRSALDRLMEVVYGELRVVADRLLKAERVDHTLEPSALVNEVYLRLEGLRELRLENRRHFYGAASRAMRRILVDHARQKKALKRGGGDLERVDLEAALGRQLDLRFDFERLDGALERLAVQAPDKARVVELRYFGGLSVEETASVLGNSTATVKRHWTFARAWLFRELSALEPPAEGPPA